MIICSVNEIEKSYGGSKIFEGLSFDFHEGHRVGLVGPNGTGKTTILKLISGEEHLDGGAIHRKKGLSIGYLAQIPSFEKELAGRDVLLKAFDSLVMIANRLKELEKLMTTPTLNSEQLERILAEYGQIQDEFTRLGGYEMDATLMMVANGLGIVDLLHQPFHLLSGGEKTKICLGLILLRKPGLLLLDEPTNHLDVEAIEWLEEYIRSENLTAVIVSHDRYFLDQVVTDIYDLDDGEVTCYHTNYSGFIKEKEKRLLDQFAAYQEQQKKIKKMKDTIRQLRQWANEGNPPNEKFYRRAKSMEKALERMEKLKRPVLERKKIGLELDTTDRSGKDVFTYENVAMEFGSKRLFHSFSYTLQHKQRVAIVGKNGTGKTTLLKMLIGEIQPSTGKVKIGSNVKLGYLSQHVFEQEGKQMVIDAFRDQVPCVEGEARQILARFLFYGPAVFKKIESLSGGERMRLRLAQLMHQDINVLLLDEPTNHLDIDSREVLEEALQDFEGTIFTVSHDRYFLNKLFTTILWLEDHTFTSYLGTYDEVKEKRINNKQIVSKEKENVEVQMVTHKSDKKVLEVEKQTAELEKKIETVELEKVKLEEEMMIESDVTILVKLQEKVDKLREEIDDLYEKLEVFL
ncbi:ribosomal protection-like ABC-F family protein [Bacillus suaedaesalsae]|uniref:ABC-F family ATP-binding cassette domain-containing protein n=1 Tax=Bacillus suaedaesalsae TaxID=2810349 RepID=A0ABS2DJH5_9BACI|nr:ABC-F family ATP-binding cassette domain-containing protein [Bacillus suaedaesalsae]MBM6617653.1 ABC-F family ATP-binding cassette domain-containing protein [Bacillus suaedaesalsae]